MSIFRVKSRATNKNVYLDNRLTNFTKPPIYYGDLHVENNETVGHDMDICGNLNIGKDLTAKNFYAKGGNYYLDTYLLVPYGTIIQSAAVNIPDGWLDCNGASFFINTYANLFGAIGYTYGGSGNNFNVPDLRGRVIVGAGTGSGLTTRNLGSTGGEETHLLTTDEMPSHTHTSNAVGETLGLAKSTGSNTASTNLDSTGGEIDLFQHPQPLTINSTGNSVAHNNMQPFMVFRYLIKY